MPNLSVALSCWRQKVQQSTSSHLHNLVNDHFTFSPLRIKRENGLRTLTQPIARMKKKVFGNVAGGSSPHRVHFKHSLLHDSVTTDRRKRQYFDISTESVATIKELDKKCVNPLHQHRCCCSCCARHNGSQSDGYLSNLSDRWSVV